MVDIWTRNICDINLLLRLGYAKIRVVISSIWQSQVPTGTWRGGEAVTQGSAKPPCTGSIPVRASKFTFLLVYHFDVIIVLYASQFN